MHGDGATGLKLGRLGNYVGFRMRRVQNQLSALFAAATTQYGIRSGLFSSLALIEANLRQCQVSEGYTIDRRNALARAAVFAGGPFDIVFLDPPYAQRSLEPWLHLSASHVAPDGIVILEHASRLEAPAAADGLTLARRLRQGDSALTFYVPDTGGAEA